MLARVQGFLGDEMAGVILQRRWQALAVVAHRIDEQALAIRKGQRQCVHHCSADRITAEPMAHVVLRRLKPNVARCYR